MSGRHEVPRFDIENFNDFIIYITNQLLKLKSNKQHVDTHTDMHH